MQHGSVFPAARNVPFKGMESQLCTQLCYQKFFFQLAKAGKKKWESWRFQLLQKVEEKQVLILSCVECMLEMNCAFN